VDNQLGTGAFSGSSLRSTRVVQNAPGIDVLVHSRLRCSCSTVLGIQQRREEVDPQVVVKLISEDLPDLLAIRQHLVTMLRFMQVKLASEESRDAAELLADRLQTLRALGQ